MTSSRVSAKFRIDLVWIVTSALTVLGAVLASLESGRHVTPSTAEAVVVLLIAAVKGRLVLREFMEVRGAPRWLRQATDAWLALLWLTVLAIYLS
jgi:hypothetical protein